MSKARSEQGEQVKESGGEGVVKYMRPAECRNHMRRTLAREFQGIVDGFVEAAKKGSCPHVKLATELLKPVRKASTRKKGSAVLYWERLQREDEEREQLERERLAVSELQEFYPAEQMRGEERMWAGKTAGRDR